MIVQARELSNKPHIVVSTPGRYWHFGYILYIMYKHYKVKIFKLYLFYYSRRLADHLESCNTFSLKSIKFLVLDEADRLLGGKFDKQIATIFSELPKEKQTLLFSATMTDTLEKVKMITKKNVS